ncbi:flagellar hook-basal body complex protein FliE [Buchnera aphidicola]|uniref:Flagellar hook-basal body complex protein FliE n=1 Tax=Buchnera aphidicola subsp. Tuberolachnus salignus TaxID=98804 RepID=A0A160SVQ5_BUCTT|nr:flagellar hook-basal body complex protein FliE [Buchnera aphidicola]CUR53027.1 Flagellar hook-basal body complex protein FliE [Buchnera aphidicola (Tuberolachnus salignus)]
MKKIYIKIPEFFKNKLYNQKLQNIISNPKKTFKNFLTKEINQNYLKFYKTENNQNDVTLKKYIAHNLDKSLDMSQKGIWMKILVQLRNKIINSFQELMNIPL